MTELAPVGYVGISPKCLLGFNKVLSSSFLLSPETSLNCNLTKTSSYLKMGFMTGANYFMQLQKIMSKQKGCGSYPGLCTNGLEVL